MGEYQAEGLGRVVYNPNFLMGLKNGVLGFTLKENPKPDKKEIETPVKEHIKTQLGNTLFKFF
ncbi:MAG: hypothetical protein IPL23_15605 [Saprospiraceae bacterium]|nr:hypothetical protein [Saprospiraceae bacterium]